MAMRIGRVGEGDGVDVTLEGVGEWSRSGNIITVSGALSADGVSTDQRSAIVSAMKEQLEGYVSNRDEPYTSVFWDEGPFMDGLYRVVSVRSSLVKGISLNLGAWPFELELQRVLDYTYPSYEIYLSGTVITNDHSFTTVQSAGDIYEWVAFPREARQLRYTDTGMTQFFRQAEDGELRVLTQPGFRKNLFLSMEPTHLYKGACRIEVPAAAAGCDPGSDSPLMTVIGNGFEYRPTEWRFTNGLVRVQHSADDPLVFEVSWYDGAAWSTPKTFDFFNDGEDPTPNDINFMAITRNSPEESVLRIGLEADVPGANFSRAYLDLHLRRGARVLRCLVTSDVASKWGVRRSSAEAASALTGGIEATSADGDGQKYVLTSPKTFTSNLTQGQIQASVATKSFYAGIGAEISGAQTEDTSQELIHQFHAGTYERQILVSGNPAVAAEGI